MVEGATQIYDNKCGVVRGIEKSKKTKTLLSCMRGSRGGYRNLWEVRGIEESMKTKIVLFRSALATTTFSSTQA